MTIEKGSLTPEPKIGWSLDEAESVAKIKNLTVVGDILHIAVDQVRRRYSDLYDFSDLPGVEYAFNLNLSAVRFEERDGQLLLIEAKDETERVFTIDPSISR